VALRLSGSPMVSNTPNREDERFTKNKRQAAALRRPPNAERADLFRVFSGSALSGFLGVSVTPWLNHVDSIAA
jgi:hypothetical protein